MNTCWKSRFEESWKKILIKIQRKMGSIVFEGYHHDRKMIFRIFYIINSLMEQGG